MSHHHQSLPALHQVNTLLGLDECWQGIDESTQTLKSKIERKICILGEYLTEFWYTYVLPQMN